MSTPVTLDRDHSLPVFVTNQPTVPSGQSDFAKYLLGLSNGNPGVRFNISSSDNNLNMDNLALSSIGNDYIAFTNGTNNYFVLVYAICGFFEGGTPTRYTIVVSR